MSERKKPKSALPKWLKPGLSRFEPKHVDFVELVAVKYPGKRWKDLTLKQQVSLLSNELRTKHWLIDPHCRRMRAWDLVVMASLIFTGFVTPYEVVFTKMPGIVLFVFNMIVWSVFLIDMILHMFLMVEMKRPGKYGTVILRDARLIRLRYLKTWFFIDLVSTLPYDLTVQIYAHVDKGGAARDSLLKAKLLKAIRLLRIIKLVRLLRTSRFISHYQNYFSLSFSTIKIIRFTCIIIVTAHWMACVWGISGLSLAMELCDDNDNRVEVDVVPVDEVSWVTALYVGGKHSPDSPCVPWNVYIASLHFSVMTITSIGYGDIVPVRAYEYILGVFCMYVGGVLWSYVIGCVCSILSHGHPVQEQFEANVDLLNMMMQDVDVPRKTRAKYREFLREAKVRDSMSMFNDVSQRFSPELRSELLLHVSEKAFRSVWYFTHASEHLIMCLTDELEQGFFARQEPLLDVKYSLGIIERGTVAHGGFILVPGNTFGEDMIITNKALQRVLLTVSITYSLVLVLSRSSLDSVLLFFPETEVQIRKSAAKLAICRTIIRCAGIKEMQKKLTPRKSKEQMNAEDELSLAQAFEALNQTALVQGLEGGPGGSPGPGKPGAERGKDGPGKDALLGFVETLTREVRSLNRKMNENGERAEEPHVGSGSGGKRPMWYV